MVESDKLNVTRHPPSYSKTVEEYYGNAVSILKYRADIAISLIGALMPRRNRAQMMKLNGVWLTRWHGARMTEGNLFNPSPTTKKCI